jgi:hypothetical protein
LFSQLILAQILLEIGLASGKTSCGLLQTRE